ARPAARGAGPRAGAAAEDRPAGRPGRDEAGEGRKTQDSQGARGVEEPVLQPLEPVLERQADPERVVVAREVAGVREVLLPGDDPAVVEVRRPEDPPAEQDEPDDPVDATQVAPSLPETTPPRFPR